jgi:hypothetical protein
MTHDVDNVGSTNNPAALQSVVIWNDDSEFAIYPLSDVLAFGASGIETAPGVDEERPAER